MGGWGWVAGSSGNKANSAFNWAKVEIELGNILMSLHFGMNFSDGDMYEFLILSLHIW